MTINLDKQLYLVILSDKGEHRIAERDLYDMSRQNTLHDLAAGEWTDFAAVIEFNPAEKSSRDVTEDFAREVMTRWANGGEPLSDWQRDFVEQHVSVQAANSFRRAA